MDAPSHEVSQVRVASAIPLCDSNGRTDERTYVAPTNDCDILQLSDARTHVQDSTSDEPHALYRFFSAEGELLYVGITNDPGRRWSDHKRRKEWWHEVASVTVEKHATRNAVLLAETQAIKSETPRYNIAGATRVKVARRTDVLTMPEGTEVRLCGCRDVEPFLNYADGARAAGLRVFHEGSCSTVLASPDDEDDDGDIHYVSDRFGTVLFTHTSQREFIVFLTGMRSAPDTSTAWARKVLAVLAAHRSVKGVPLTLSAHYDSHHYQVLREEVGEFAMYSKPQMRVKTQDRIAVTSALMDDLEAVCEEFDEGETR